MKVDGPVFVEEFSMTRTDAEEDEANSQQRSVGTHHDRVRDLLTSKGVDVVESHPTRVT